MSIQHKFTEIELIVGCQKYNKQIQQEVYEKYSPVLRAVCARYARDYSETEDILQEGFIKIFTNVKSFTYQGKDSYIKWMKRVMVNAAITYYNKHTRKRKEYSIEDTPIDDDKNDKLLSNEEGDNIYNASVLSKEDILNILQSVPEDFRLVFNLYVIEGYEHKEIAKMLNIKTETSRTRLLRAKKLIKQEIIKIDSSFEKQ